MFKAGDNNSIASNSNIKGPNMLFSFTLKSGVFVEIDAPDITEARKLFNKYVYLDNGQTPAIESVIPVQNYLI